LNDSTYVAAALVVDNPGNIYVTGTNGAAHTGDDYFTVKYNSAGIEQWVARYNGSEGAADIASALAMDASGSVYVTGESSGDYATVKYNSAGLEQWEARLNGGYSDENAVAMATDAIGNVYVTGTSVGDYATVKYNSAGIEQWVTRYHGGEAAALAVDSFDNVYVTGTSVWEYATVKYNSAGNEQWAARSEGSRWNRNRARALAVDDAGNVYVTGYIAFLIDMDFIVDYATIKYNSLGVEQWIARYSGGEATALTVDVSGNVYVTGTSGDDYTTVKYNPAGIEQWVSRYNGPGNEWDCAAALAVDASGNVYVTGNSATIKYNSDGVQQWANVSGADALVVDTFGNVYVTGEIEDDIATVKYNSDGVEQWVARYNGPANGFDDAAALAVEGSGNIYVTGTSEGSGTDVDFATIKYNSEGFSQWVARYNGPGNSNDYAVALAADNSGNVYVTGSSEGDGWRIYTTIKYVQTPVSVENEAPVSPSHYWLAQNYPNPFNPSTTIEFTLPKSTFVTLKVYNLLGEEVATLIAEQRSAGIHKLNWDARGLASGVYLYRLEAGEFVQVKKLILMR
jgi:uncharacterized delta-60 repeat protein